jgi:hypothetical protein
MFTLLLSTLHVLYGLAPRAVVALTGMSLYLRYRKQDALGPSREGGDDLQGRRLLAELLLQVRLQRYLHCYTYTLSRLCNCVCKSVLCDLHSLPHIAVVHCSNIDSNSTSKNCPHCANSDNCSYILLCALQVGGLKPGDGVAVIAATNRAEDVDVALLRRFHARVAVPPPAAAELKRMCWAFLEGVEHCIADADLQALSRRLEGR